MRNFWGYSVALAFATTALADRYHLRYDADEVYPEDAGWSHYRYDPDGVYVRTLDNNTLTLDGTASLMTADLYQVQDSALALAPGERLTVSWRMRTLMDRVDPDNRSDVRIYLATPFLTGVSLHLNSDSVAHDENGSPPDAEIIFAFEPTEFHTFEFSTTDYEQFELTVDGAFAFDGRFSGGGVNGPRIAFGDSVVGRSSASEWDFMEVSITPESTTLLPLAMCFALYMRARRGP